MQLVQLVQLEKSFATRFEKNDGNRTGPEPVAFRRRIQGLDREMS